MSKRGKIRCDECVYWGNPRPSKSTRGAMGDCHFSPPRNEDRFVPGYAIWPVTTEDDWCGQFKHPKITGDSRTALYRSLLNTTRPLTGAEMLDMILASLRGYPNAGGDVEVMTEVDRIVTEEVNAALAQVKRYKVEDERIVGKVDQCVCNGVGCNSCEPGGRG